MQDPCLETAAGFRGAGGRVRPERRFLTGGRDVRIFTIGYGGRKPRDLLALLRENGIRTVVDVRLRPDRACLGSYVRARDPDRGIVALLAGAGIEYRPFVELGNVFLDFQDWPERYRQLLQRAGDLLTQRLAEVPEPFCLLCAEKRSDECHRKLIADYLVRRGREVEHIE